MAQRLRRRLVQEGIAFKQHRLRSTCARRLHEAGYPDSAIMEILGWSSMAMLRRYLGKIPVAQLKRYPTTLERVFGRAVWPATMSRWAPCSREKLFRKASRTRENSCESSSLGLRTSSHGTYWTGTCSSRDTGAWRTDTRIVVSCPSRDARNDDVACWDADQPKQVLIIHDLAESDWAQRKVFDGFYAWLRQAVDDLIEFDSAGWK